MSKKLTKTIILIVFVVLLGIKDVEAKKLGCTYAGKDGDNELEVYLTIDDSNLNTPPKASGTFNGDDSPMCKSDGWQTDYITGETYCVGSYAVENWNGSVFTDFDYTGLNDYLTNGNNCPKYLVYVKESNFIMSESFWYYLGDSDNYINIRGRAATKHKNTVFNVDADVYSVELSKQEVLVEDAPEPEPDPEEEEETEEGDDSEHPKVGESGRVSGDTGSKGYCGVVDGKPTMKNIPAAVPRMTKFIYNFLQVLVPLAIIILGSIDLVKAISAQKEDEIKKGQQMLIKRLITAVIVFFVFALVKLLVSVVSDNSQGIVDCVNCFLTKENKYCNFN